MGFFNDFSNKNSLNSQLNKVNADIEAMLKDLGWNYYEKNKNSANDDFKQILDMLKQAFEQKRNLELQMAWMRGVTVCQNCGKDMPMNLNFCTSCGSRLIKPINVAEVQPISQPQPPVAQQPPIAQPQQPPAQQPYVPKTERFCTTCGNRVSENAAFCTQCGSKL